MLIADNILKEHLKNVYFISGSANGGKSTIGKHIAEKYGFTLYSVDENFGNYKEMSDKVNQPAMNRPFIDWEEYFNRPPKEYAEWLDESIRESIGFAIVDLLLLAQRGKVVVEGMFPVEELTKITNYNRCIFLLVDYDLTRQDFFKRDDKDDLYRCIMGMKNPEKTLANVFDAITYNHKDYVDKVKASGFKYLVREKTTDYEEYKRLVEEHLGL